jgi:hypothetical protein
MNTYTHVSTVTARDAVDLVEHALSERTDDESPESKAARWAAFSPGRVERSAAH